MTVLAIGTYIQLYDINGTPRVGKAWQNFHQGQARTFDGTSYQFAGFAYSGGSVDLESASITATVVMGLNDLSISIFQEACDLKDLMEVKTVWLDPDNDLIESPSLYSQDLYTVVNFNHNNARITITLGSPIEAVGAQTHRRLTTNLVGSLPPNGGLRISG